jgi:hypothetical protein
VLRRESPSTFLAIFAVDDVQTRCTRYVVVRVRENPMRIVMDHSEPGRKPPHPSRRPPGAISAGQAHTVNQAFNADDTQSTLEIRLFGHLGG